MGRLGCFGKGRLGGDLGGGVSLILAHDFAERTRRDHGALGGPAAVLACQVGVVLDQRADPFRNGGGGCRRSGRGGFGGLGGVGDLLCGAPGVLVLQGLDVEDAHQKPFLLTYPTVNREAGSVG